MHNNINIISINPIAADVSPIRAPIQWQQQWPTDNLPPRKLCQSKRLRIIIHSHNMKFFTVSSLIVGHVGTQEAQSTANERKCMPKTKCHCIKYPIQQNWHCGSELGLMGKRLFDMTFATHVDPVVGSCLPKIKEISYLTSGSGEKNNEEEMEDRSDNILICLKT